MNNYIASIIEVAGEVNTYYIRKVNSTKIIDINQKIIIKLKILKLGDMS
ncbi:MAG: hypothetical protein WC755_03230 [Candidatus Woesearchaeota archaeon]|jgi:hypothetical protein